ncbi:MAG: VanZ family protein, partial [Deltaproteobacteria bacterium]|nr:VanZ family protein [Deltaproteobacteria bacterium]
IYSTLGLVRGWSEILREHGLAQSITTLAVAFFLFLSISWGWQRASRNQRLGRVGISILLVTGALLVNFPEERIHLVEYGLIGLMLGWALAGISRWPELWPLAVALVWMVGLGDELIQAVLPNRVYDVRDIVLNGLAGMAGLYLFETHCVRDCKTNEEHEQKN